MKTYSIIYAFLAFVVIGCSTSDDSTLPEENQEEQITYEADYVLLQQSNGQLSVEMLEADDSELEVSSAESTFANVPLPDVTFRKASTFAFYTKVSDCDGQVTIHDFETEESTSVDVFGDLLECDLTVTSITLDGDILYVAYYIEETSKITKYYVRTLDLANDANKMDIELDKKPSQMVVTNGRLFVLTLDWDITDEYELSVIDTTSLTVLHEVDLGYNVKRIFEDHQKNIIVSYQELHTVLNSTTLAVKYVNYEEATAPKFSASEMNCFDASGRLFYIRPDDSGLLGVPAIYDFADNKVLLYYYGNFLTATQLTFEFKIGQTTMVSYDDDNNVMLVGYQKSDDGLKGGLLRIQLEPEPKFLDNLDLNGVPYQVFYKNQ